MKKFGIFAIILFLGISLVACGGNDSSGADASTTTTPSTNTDIIPDTNPTSGTNIPDPNVDSTMPDNTDGTDPTGTTGNSGKMGASRWSY